MSRLNNILGIGLFAAVCVSAVMKAGQPGWENHPIWLVLFALLMGAFGVYWLWDRRRTRRHEQRLMVIWEDTERIWAGIRAGQEANREGRQ
jgi:Flp pilus assembly protein TadB